MNCKNTYNHPLSRVRIRAHSQEFYCFCCHKCHRLLHKSLNNSILQPYDKRFLTFQRCTLSNYMHRDSKKRTFYPTVLLFFLHFLLPYSSLSALRCDTCDSKKSKSLQNARALHVRTRNTHRIALAFFISRWEEDEANTHLHRILTPTHCNTNTINRKNCSFLRFIPSLGLYLPIYLQRHANKRVALILFSHGESHLIHQTYDSTDYYPQSVIRPVQVQRSLFVPFEANLPRRCTGYICFAEVRYTKSTNISSTGLRLRPAS